MSNKLQTVSFHNQKITVLNHDNKPYIEMRSIVENIGLDWGAQLKRIKRNNILNSTMVIMTTVAKDGKNRELICLPLGYLNGWLFGIDTNRVKEEIRPTLEQYQLECFDVLYNHFMPKVAQQFPNTITSEQQQAIKQAVNERAYRTGEHHQSVYHKLYEAFKIPRYQDLPSSKFDAAIKFLGGIMSNKSISITESNLECLISHSLWIFNFWREKRLREAFKMIGSDFGVRMENHIDSCYSLSIGLKRELETTRKLAIQ